MKEQIKKLVELANEYADFVNRSPIETHTRMRYGEESDEIVTLYFTNKKEYAITFGKIEINEYMGNITIPINYTENNLERAYCVARELLDKKKEIKKLKEKLEELQKEVR